MKTLVQQRGSSREAFQVPPVLSKRLMAVVNVVVRGLLRSPLHFLLSESLLLLTYWGQKSGKRYTNPVSYTREGAVVTVTAFTSRTWWKQVRVGASVLVEIKRQQIRGTAEVISEDHAKIIASLLALLRKNPRLAKGYHIPLNADGHPDPDAIHQLAHVVVVRIHLEEHPSTRGGD